jgi:FkbM family methyltransferase
MFKKMIKAIFSKFGYEIRRMPHDHTMQAHGDIYTTRTTMDELLKHCKTIGMDPATVIDVGVAYATLPLYTNFSDKRHLLIEPMVEYEGSLKRICKKFDAEYVLAAAGPEDGEISIHIGRNLDGSTIMAPSNADEMYQRVIPMVRLDDVCKQKGMVGPYLLKVDVQGAELLVLEGAEKILSECDLVILEVSFFNFRPNFPDLYDVINYMKDKGFVVYEIYGGHNRPLDGARAQADIAFVKDHGIFRKSHKWSA